MSAIPLFAETPVEVIRNELEQTLQLQRDAYLAHPYPDLEQRKADLRKLQAFLRDHREAILDAISADYGNRSRHETLFAEFYGVIDGVDHAISHLRKWMKPQRRSVDLKNFFGASNRVIPQPVGVVGHIVPWNFPIFLCFGGLTSAFAAGNRCMVKMSENSRRLAQLLIDKAPAYFPKDKLAFFDETGGVGIEFSKLKFDHILFTGSGLTGRAVMAAASTNLCPVTLELGGKAPALVCDDFPLQKATERITFFKYFNAGQICTTADHVFVPQHKVSEFVEIARRTVSARYPSLDSPDFTSVIDERAFNRITRALDEAQERGATLVQLVPGPKWDAATRKIAPHIVLNTPADCELRTREIFGPVLPVIPYTSVDEVVNAINAGPRPLAFYPFSNDKRLIHDLIHRVMSGGVTVNDIVLHTGQHDMPFGGIGDSGMGHYHGYEGFVTFSKLRPVFYQAPFSAIKFLWPPYGKFATKYLDFLTR
ncbi:coniferyl aldehyde dehydrogenase [Candidatus Skiveiella danica]|jgi:coniferyl-aldehyde dehydrogenase|uniref:coniferyl aldehyde dehydrogenase n=1 Tax=Candidatus Skiveiella danica TaxID=3386177 RepID=UPI001DBF2DCD|nr:coniferyl aldehyde dehydrogenase [Betaproteobacteria bacterium]